MNTGRSLSCPKPLVRAKKSGLNAFTIVALPLFPPQLLAQRIPLLHVLGCRIVLTATVEDVCEAKVEGQPLAHRLGGAGHRLAKRGQIVFRQFASQQCGQLSVGGSQFWVEPKGHPVGGLRLFQLAQFFQKVPQITVARRERGTELDHRTILLHRFCKLALLV
jgi:hypothetical protein